MDDEFLKKISRDYPLAYNHIHSAVDDMFRSKLESVAMLGGIAANLARLIAIFEKHGYITRTGVVKLMQFLDDKYAEEMAADYNSIFTVNLGDDPEANT